MCDMDLDSPIEHIAGVGPAYAKVLKARGVTTVEQVLYTVPHRYIDYTHPVDIASVKRGQAVVIHGRVGAITETRTARRAMTLIRARISDESGSIDALWFNQPYLRQVLKPGTTLRLHGPAAFDAQSGTVLRSPTILPRDDDTIVSVYSERTGLASGRFSQIVARTLHFASDVLDPLPDSVRKTHQLVPINQALSLAHRPQNLDDVHRGLDRLALDELWSVMVVMRRAKQRSATHKAPSIPFETARLMSVQNGLPFTLTTGQREVISAIQSDIARSVPMRRLLNGDVGSGKTIVAFMVADQVLRAAHHVALVSPTTVLAEQHYRTWQQFNSDHDSFLFTSKLIAHNGQSVSRKTALLALGQSRAAFLCGTHSLFHDEISRNRTIGLVVVDEQHRFGVLQRALLTDKQRSVVPHLLSLSATPIPRTAALVLYGDLDVSYLLDKPHNRGVVTTKLASERSRPHVYRFMNQLIDKGEQVFVVCPAIMPADDEVGARLFMLEERKAVVEEFERLKIVFPTRRIGLLHGKMTQKAKEAVLDQFRAGTLDILVATSVIEVGVDIPNASCMVIEGAEYFGLAPLHQLRGRVGRSTKSGYCFLFANTWNEQTTKRLQLLVKHTDGFTLAEQDLAIRGPGDLYGTVQAGITPFRFASLSNAGLVHQASEISAAILQLSESAWSPTLRKWIEDRSSMIHRE